MSTHSVAVTLVNQWFSHIGLPDVVTSETFDVRTAPYHSQVNGMVERLQRTLKDVLTTQESTHWSTKLPLVLLTLRSTVKSDVGLAPAEMVYGTTLRLPG